MKECPNCKNSVDDDVAFCSNCGANLNQDMKNPENEQFVNQNYQANLQYQYPPVQGNPQYQTIPVYGYQQQLKRDVPKCTCCGNIGEMKPGPLLTSHDILWFLLLLCLAGAGFIFLIYKLITRADPAKREKICPKCGSKNMFTYVY